ncbi:lipocalin family protein [Mucilaginibacter ginsenosidivorans]|uniref:Lipocalin-like domain-containing protein n=1 Tax=Mucilaginibacter ginsenosidivorans TaxID=398053 RepID=A0A5B8UXF2_9SPHI|nr:lipocalin family protein [Mucilaginibacter ginsenosidivorans]QEC63345.1 hypothetical protein FRZ54_12420 [Mucilaginibacter ginsenosidivorans]
MMRKFYFLLLAVSVPICMASCGKGGNNVAPSQLQVNLIVGKWSLQQEKYVQYIDAIERQNVTMTTSANNIATVQFNKDGTFASASTYTSDPAANPGAGPTSESATTHGTYSFSDNSFHMSAPYVTGLADGTVGSYGFAGNVAIPTYSAVSNSVVINELTANSLKLHIEVVYTLTVNNVTDTYKTIGDYSYSK